MNKCGLDLNAENALICSFDMKEATDLILGQKISTAPFVNLFDVDEKDGEQVIALQDRMWEKTLNAPLMLL